MKTPEDVAAMLGLRACGWGVKTRHQRCRVYKVAIVLNKVPKSVQRTMKADLAEIRDTPDRTSAEAAVAVFIEKYAAKYSKAVECLAKDTTASKGGSQRFDTSDFHEITARPVGVRSGFPSCPKP